MQLLGEITTISTGLVISRKKAQGDQRVKAKYKLLSLKNINEDGTINNEPLEELHSYEVLEPHYFTNEGDVLFRFSYPYTAVYIDQQHSGLLVPSYFAIIKVHHKGYMPQFIAWYLNSAGVKKELERSQSGSRIPSANQNALKLIPIAQPTLDKQLTFIKLLRLHQQEKSLYNKLIRLKEVWFQGISVELLQDEEIGGE